MLIPLWQSQLVRGNRIILISILTLVLVHFISQWPTVFRATEHLLTDRTRGLPLITTFSTLHFLPCFSSILPSSASKLQTQSVVQSQSSHLLSRPTQCLYLPPLLHDTLKKVFRYPNNNLRTILNALRNICKRLPSKTQDNMWDISSPLEIHMGVPT